MIRWSLFLDDERFPPISRFDDWIIARTVDQAKQLIAEMGPPWQMSLDHDLGPDTETGYDFVKWLIEEFLDQKLNPFDFERFTIHSQNPVGASNMQQYWDSGMKFCSGTNR